MPLAVAELTPAHFERIAALRPEVVIFGSGPKLQFVAPALQRALLELRIGVETMDTAAACRTYNVLASERRRVLAALSVPCTTVIPPNASSPSLTKRSTWACRKRLVPNWMIRRMEVSRAPPGPSPARAFRWPSAAGRKSVV